MISVCYSGNKRIFEGIMLSAMSAIAHTEESVRFYVLTMDLTDQNPMFEPIDSDSVRALSEVAREKNPDSGAELINLTELYCSEMKDGKNSRSSYTPYALLRLFLDRLPDMPDKMLYLDADTMVSGDLAELFGIDVEGKEFAAVPDHLGRVFIYRRYCNTGVLLLNLALIQKTGLFERARAMCRSRRMIMADQTAINRQGLYKLYLPRRFNEQRALRPDTVVKHFCKAVKYYGLFIKLPNIKQWQREAVRTKLKITAFDPIYESYDRVAQKYGIRSYDSFCAAPKTRKSCLADPACVE